MRNKQPILFLLSVLYFSYEEGIPVCLAKQDRHRLCLLTIMSSFDMIFIVDAKAHLYICKYFFYSVATVSYGILLMKDLSENQRHLQLLGITSNAQDVKYFLSQLKLGKSSCLNIFK